MSHTNTITTLTNLISGVTKRHYFTSIYAIDRRPVLRIPEEDYRGGLGCCVGGEGGGGEVD